MNVVEGLLSVLLIVAIIVLVLGFLGIKYGTLEKQMRIEASKPPTKPRT